MARMMDAVQRAIDLEFRGGTRENEQPWFSLRTLTWILATGICYYLATRVAWLLCFPDSKVSLFFPPHAILVSILLLVPTRHWWAYTLAAVGSHFIATQQAGWPPLYALQCEAFDAVKFLLAAAGIRLFIKSPFHLITLREAIVFVLIAVILVPFGTAFWGAAFTVSNNFGTRYWVEWRNLGVSNGVTAIVLVPAILIGAHQLFLREGPGSQPLRMLEAGLLAVGTAGGRLRSPSIGCPRDRTLRPRSSMRPFPCSSGRRCASGSAASAPRCWSSRCWRSGERCRDADRS